METLNLFQCHPIQFQGRKAGQKERGRERAPFQLIRNRRSAFFKAVFFEPLCQFLICHLGLLKLVLQEGAGAGTPFGLGFNSHALGAYHI